MKKQNVKICFIASSGGHFEQLMTLKPLMEKYDSFIVTEKTPYSINNNIKNKTYFLKQVNRKEIMFVPNMITVFLKSMYIFIKEKPNVIISTGVLAAIPMMFIGHFMKKKVIYIESFAKIKDPTMTGKLIYNKHIADQFYVQWESMLNYYPNAIYLGGIY